MTLTTSTTASTQGDTLVVPLVCCWRAARSRKPGADWCLASVGAWLGEALSGGGFREVSNGMAIVVRARAPGQGQERQFPDQVSPASGFYGGGRLACADASREGDGCDGYEWERKARRVLERPSGTPSVIAHASGRRALNASSACPPGPAQHQTSFNSVRGGWALEMDARRRGCRHWMRQLDPERSDCASFGVGFG